MKKIVVYPLRYTSLQTLKLERMPLKDLLNQKKISLLKRTAPYTYDGYIRLSNIYDLSVDIEKRNLEGAFVECGVWKGGLATTMGAVANRYGNRRKTWYFDSFEGMPDPTAIDGEGTEEIMGEALFASKEEVEKLVFDTLQLPREHNILVKGWFEDTIPKAKKEIGDIAILRIDADWYEGTKYCLHELYDSVVLGGYVVFDDYGRWVGARRATDEFFEERGLHPKKQFMGGYGARPMFFKKEN